MIVLNLIGKSVLFFLPAFVANGAPVVFQYFPLIKKIFIPICPRFLGRHKTWGGFIVASSWGLIIGGILGFFFNLYPIHLTLAGLKIGSALAGLGLGFSSAFGDSVESFIKRRKGLEEGETWWLDWADWWLFGVCPMALLFFLIDGLDWKILPVSIILIPLALLVNYIGVLLRIKESY